MSESEARALNEISGQLGKLEALYQSTAEATRELTANVNRLVDKLDRSDDIAREADQRARSAHHRIAELSKEIKELRTEQRWAIGTAISICGLFIAAIGFLWKALVH